MVVRIVSLSAAADPWGSLGASLSFCCASCICAGGQGGGGSRPKNLLDPGHLKPVKLKPANLGGFGIPGVPPRTPILQQEGSVTWCDLFRPKLAKKTPKIITLHDVLEALKQALLASCDEINFSQDRSLKLQSVFTLGDRWLAATRRGDEANASSVHPLELLDTSSGRDQKTRRISTSWINPGGLSLKARNQAQAKLGAGGCGVFSEAERTTSTDWNSENSANCVRALVGIIPIFSRKSITTTCFYRCCAPTSQQQ